MTNALNLCEINQEEAINLLTFFINTGGNFLLLGQKGTGKTNMSLQTIKACRYKANYINLSVLERPDLAGYPNIHSTDDIVTFKSPYYLPKLLENQTPDSVILFDEIDKCSPEMMAPLLEILQFKKINGKPLNVAACILTGNLANENCYSNQISGALLDRTAKFVLNFEFNIWVDWAKANGVHDLIIGFLRSNPSLACGDLDDSTYASPSPRGWTWASDALLKTKKLKVSDIDSVSQIVSGFVGSEAGLKFKIWYQYYRRFEPYIHSLIERGNMSLNFEEMLPTEKMVFIISSCYYAKLKVIEDKSKNRFVYLERLIDFFDHYKVDSEMQVMGLHNSFDLNIISKNKLYNCKPFFEHFKKLNEGVAFSK